MNTRLVRAVVTAAAVAAVLLGIPQPATAGKWVFKPSLNGGPHLWEYHHTASDYSHLSNSAPAAHHPRDVAYSVTLHNPTRWTVSYSLNDQREPLLKPGESVRWTIMGSRENPAHFAISFDNGRKLQVRYDLKSSGVFEFHDKGAGIDLYEKR